MKNLVPIKLVTIIGLDALKHRLIDDLKTCGMKGYTISVAEGEGLQSRNFTEMEGLNFRIETLVSAKVADEIIDLLSQKYFEMYGVIAFVNTVEVLRPEKFS